MTVYFLYDEYGYLKGNLACEQQPERSTTIEPEFKSGYWAVFDSKANKWTYEKKPASAADLEGKTVASFTDATVEGSDHDKELYALFQPYLDADHKIVTNDDGTVTFARKSKEDYQSEKDLADRKELAEDMAGIKADIISAIAKGDDTWLSELKAEYKKLIGD